MTQYLKAAIKEIKEIGVITGVMLGVWSLVSGALSGLMGFIDLKTFGAAKALEPIPGLFVTCLLNVLIVRWFISKSRLSNYKLALTVFVIIFGPMFVMTQMETIYFNAAIKMPWQIIFSTVFTGLFVSLVVSFLVVLYNKNKPSDFQNDIKIKISHVFLKFIVLSLLYLLFYFFFGYFIAWQFPALREYYSGSADILPFFGHMQEQIKNNVGLILFQIFRGFLWAGIAFLVTVNISGKLLECLIITGLVLSIGLASPLFLPNPYMPATVRFGHFFELLAENFLFGFIAALLFRPLQNYASSVQ